MTQTSISIIAVIIALIIFLWFYVFLPIRMARKRERSALGWVLLFWILSPLWGIIILLILGDSKQKIRKDIMKDLKRN